MITSRHTAVLLEESLHDRLHNFESCLRRSVPARESAQGYALQHEMAEALRAMSTLAPWVQAPGRQDHLIILQKLARGLLQTGNSSRERILSHLYRVLQRLMHPARWHLQRLLRQRLAQVDAARQAGLAEPRQSPACPLTLLKQASEFLEPGGKSGNGFMALLVCRKLAREQLERLLHHRMQDLAEASSHTGWSVETFVRSGVAHKTRQLVLLATFAEDDLQSILGRLEQLMLRQHVQRGPASEVDALHRLLQGLILGKPVQGQLVQISSPANTQDAGQVPDAAALAELSAALENLRQALQAIGETPELMVSPQLLRGCNRLGWMLDVAGFDGLGLAAHALSHTCLQFWQWRQPITPGLQDTLQSFLLQLQDSIAGGSCRHEPGFNLASELLAQCPQLAQQSVPATAIALDLANQFEMLVAVRQDLFVSHESFLQQTALLQKELRLLEQGAAAVRLRPLEQFTSLLLDIHHLSAVHCPQRDVAAELLWQGHRHLLAMLDEAALWFEPLPDQSLLLLMSDWVGDAEALLAETAAAQSGAMLPNPLQVALTCFVRQAGKLLGRPSRLVLDAGNIATERQQHMVPITTELLRWVLLQGTVGSGEGSSQPRTRALVVQMTCRVLPGARIQAVFVDDCGNRLPDPALQRRLQRVFPASDINLKAQLQQHGTRLLELEFAA